MLGSLIVYSLENPNIKPHYLLYYMLKSNILLLRLNKANVQLQLVFNYITIVVITIGQLQQFYWSPSSNYRRNHCEISFDLNFT